MASNEHGERAPGYSGPRSERGRLRRGRDVARYEGLRSFTAKLLGHVCFRRLVLVGAPLDRAHECPESDLDLDVSVLRSDHLDAYLDFMSVADPNRRARMAEGLDAALARGSRCYAAWLEGEIVSTAWVDLGSAVLDAIGARVVLDPLDAYGRDAYTAREYRKHHAASVRLARALEGLREEGYECFFGFVLPENKRAFALHARVGLQRFGSVGWFGLGPLRVYFVTAAGFRPRYSPRLKRRGRLCEVEIGRPCARAPGPGRHRGG